MDKLKEQLYARCKQHVQERIDTAQKGIDEARASQANETKSSAGDKYETGRAMAQQEIDRNTALLAETRQLLNALDKVNTVNRSEIVTPGSVVITDKANFYLAISAGTIVLDGQKYFAISPVSPMGIKLLGKAREDKFEMNKITYTIIKLQ